MFIDVYSAIKGARRQWSNEAYEKLKKSWGAFFCAAERKQQDITRKICFVLYFYVKYGTA